ncbi:MAG: flagellar basal body P-ring formation chaperone FlgA [Syntrophobacteraceae bacterium]|nr:flagellar basal body P-ring formation chaperone FlgA [Syntrophobacteraceae bacterium]
MSGRSEARFVILTHCLIIFLAAGMSLGSWTTCLGMEPMRELRARPEVWIESDRVNILHLFEGERLPEEWRSLMAGIDLGEAPIMGREKFIGSAPLRSYLEKLIASQGLDPSRVIIDLPPDQVVLKRKTSRIAPGEIEEIYRNHILNNAPWRPEDLEISGITHSGLAELPAGKVSHVVDANPRERYVGNVILTIHFLADGGKKRSIRVAGKVQLHREVVVAARPLSRNDILTELDVQLQRMPVGENTDRYATRVEQVVGRRLVRDAELHQSLMLTDLDSPLILRKGAPVTILYEQPGLRISAKGQAREDGGAGKAIRVLNTQTNRTVISEIMDGSTVRAIH